MVKALESRGRPRDLWLNTTFPRVQEILVATHALSEARLLHIAAVEGKLTEDGFWYPPVRVHELTGVKLDVDSGLVFSRGWVINGSGTGHRWAMDSAFLTGGTVRVSALAAVKEARVVGHLGQADHMYHFLMESLPKLLRMRQVNPDVLFVTAEEPGRYARTILALLGIEYEVRARNSVLACESLLVCEGFPGDRTHPDDMDLISETFVRLLPEISDAPNGRVYISRSASLRPLECEVELESVLMQRGFQILTLEHLPLLEQVRHLSRARTVVAPHGAGLANAVFMRPGGSMLEIATGEMWNNAFRRIAGVRELQYELVMVPSLGTDIFGRGDARDAIPKVLGRLDGWQ